MEASFEKRNSRRSATNLSHLTLAPLSSRLPIDADIDSSEPTDSNDGATWHRTSSSYIVNRSAPTTPRILSRSPSLHRLSSRTHNRSFTDLAVTSSNDIDAAAAATSTTKASTDLPTRSKSSTSVAGLPRSQAHHRARLHNSRAPMSLFSSSTSVATDSGEWLFRAGTAISSEARETKGQGWLISRESSTSLVAQAHDDDDDRDTGYSRDDEGVRMAPTSGATMSGLDRAEYGYGFGMPDPAAPNGSYPGASMKLATAQQSRVASRSVSRNASQAASRVASRAASRNPSARPSRRGSRVNLRSDLSYFTPAVRSPSVARDDVQDYFGMGKDLTLAGPDFVDRQDEDEDDLDSVDFEERERRDEEEVAKLASERGLGLGGIVDRLIGWTLFDVRGDGLETDDEDEAGENGDATPRSNVSAPKAQDTTLTARLDAAKVKSLQRQGLIRAPSTQEVEQGGWKDAAWLLSVASKVLL